MPRDLAVGYNGTVLIFNISEEEAKNRFLRDSPPLFSTSQFTGKDATITDDLTIIPVMAERLDVNKKESLQEEKIIKEPISEIKTVEVPITHDELYIETRSIGNRNEQQAANPSIHSDFPEQEEVITLFLRAEVPEVLRHYHLKEEFVVKKKSLTKSREYQ